MKLLGEKTTVEMNAFAFKTLDSQGQEIFMLGTFMDTTFSSATTRTGWFVFDEVVEDIAKLTSTKVKTALGTLRKSGKTFKVYLSSMPGEATSRDGKPRFNVRDITPVGFEYEE